MSICVCACVFVWVWESVNERASEWVSVTVYIDKTTINHKTRTPIKYLSIRIHLPPCSTSERRWQRPIFSLVATYFPIASASSRCSMYTYYILQHLRLYSPWTNPTATANIKYRVEQIGFIDFAFHFILNRFYLFLFYFSLPLLDRIDRKLWAVVCDTAQLHVRWWCFKSQINILRTTTMCATAPLLCSMRNSAVTAHS